MDTIGDCRADVSGAYIYLSSGEVYKPSMYLRGSSCVPTACEPAAVLADSPEVRRFFVINAGWRNYFHWLLQASFTCFLIEKFFHDQGYEIILPRLEPWQALILQRAGIPESRIIITDPAETLSAPRLSVLDTSYGGYVHNTSPEMIDYAEKMLQGREGERNAGKLFISRRDSGKRVVDNEDKIEEILVTRGFEVVCLSNFSLDEQINMFRHAKVIVGAHGAGLSNIIFCQPGTKIIEFASSHYINHCFARLAQLFDLQYEMHIFKSTEGVSRHKTHWVVDLAYVDQLDLS